MVALLAEGVDRNRQARGPRLTVKVALLAEGVDRNQIPLTSVMPSRGRPPRGGRG